MSTYSLTLRKDLNRKLTIQEMDNNFLYLQDLGLLGVIGATGPQGSIGFQGSQGPIGLTGFGFQGPQGFQGVNGNIGVTGSNGPQGVTGPAAGGTLFGTWQYNPQNTPPTYAQITSNASPTNSTTISLYNYDRSNQSYKGVFKLIGYGFKLLVQTTVNDIGWISYLITDTPIDNNTYTTFPVSLISYGADGSNNWNDVTCLFINNVTPGYVYGNATLISGSVSVSNTLIKATSNIILTRKTISGTPSFESYTVTNGSFTITSGPSDNSTFTYIVI